MHIPEFTAEASLRKPHGHYQLRSSRGSGTPGSVQAQLTPPRQGCWCSEPDWLTVCHAGHCTRTEICLQWTCPPLFGWGYGG